MDSIASTRSIALLLSLGSGMMFAQSTLPSTTPTTIPAATLTGVTPASPIMATHASRANVSYIQGQLQITADDSSLNQILREIGRLTGMTITGGVIDQRVFGKYGPAAPPEILTTLLQGTGSNMLLLDGAPNASAQLILTPQQGGPTPPNPNAPGFDDDASAPVPPSDQPPRPQYAPPIPPPGRSRFGGLSPQPSAAGTADPSTTSAPSDNSSPNGVRTPQQIYQQLQQLQNAQPQPH